MKTLSLLFVNFCFTVLSYAQSGTLEVSIEKNNNLEGEIYIGVFTEEGFLMQPFASSGTEMKENYATAVFENFDHGTYAISAYQDVNSNQTLDMDAYGRPTEPWVISGASSSLMPIWSESKFDFNSEKQTIKLKI
jgi:uncharacterized protein (DUF2141 family)